MTRREALGLIDDWLATGFRRSRGDAAASEQPGSESGGPPTPELGAQMASAKARAAVLAAVAAEVAGCSRCSLAVGRTTTVPGEGSLDPPVLFVGEGPGEEEDRSGRPFVGAAGRYLDKWIAAIGLARGACYIANCVKCRPPQNREPRPDESAACLPYLERQIVALAPRAICCLGRIAAQVLLATGEPLSRLRGPVRERAGIPVVVTYHPSAVLRDQSLRAAVWQDLKMLKSLLDHGFKTESA